MSKAEKILNFFWNIKEKKLNDIKSVKDSEVFDKETQKFLSDYLAQIHFKNILKVDWTKDLRLEVIKLSYSSKNELKFSQFKNAHIYLDFEASKLIIKIGFFEKLIGYSSLILAFIFMFLGVFLLIITPNETVSLLTKIYLYSISFVFIAAGLIFTKEFSRMLSINEIKKELKRINYYN